MQPKERSVHYAILTECSYSWWLMMTRLYEGCDEGCWGWSAIRLSRHPEAIAASQMFWYLH